jgi:hypothetical protein
MPMATPRPRLSSNDRPTRLFDALRHNGAHDARQHHRSGSVACRERLGDAALLGENMESEIPDTTGRAEPAGASR